MEIDDVLGGRHHHPKIRKNSQHQAYAQIAVRHRKDAYAPKYLISSHKDKIRIAHRRIAFVSVCDSLLFQIFRFLFIFAKKIILLVGSPYLMKQLKRFGQRRLKHFDSPVLFFFELAYISGQFRRKKNNDRVGNENKKRQLPMDPQQYRGGENQSQRSDDKPRDRRADKTVDGFYIGHQLGGYRAYLHHLVRFKRNVL